MTDLLTTVDAIASYQANKGFELIIPPDVARKLVADTLAQPGERALYTKGVERYAEVMLEGKWVYNPADSIVLCRHDGIVVILNGKLILAAIMRSNRAQKMAVIFVDESNFRKPNPDALNKCIEAMLKLDLKWRKPNEV